MIELVQYSFFGVYKNKAPIHEFAAKNRRFGDLLFCKKKQQKVKYNYHNDACAQSLSKIKVNKAASIKSEPVQFKSYN